jgi:hypothetical protein
MAFEILILLLVILAAIAAYYILKSIGDLIINTVLGLLLLAAANFIFKLGIAYTIPTILVCAFGGVPGAILVILLHHLHVAF